MTSPIKIFHNGQTGAPVLSGQLGKNVDLLDAVLINGYNTKAPSAISVTSNVVTVTATSHGYSVYDTIVLSGVTDKTELNAEWRIESAVTDSFTFTSSTSTDGSAAGTFSTKIAPLGWSKPFSGTNLAAYRSLDNSSGRFFLYADDNSDANETTVYTYEQMTSISSGYNQGNVRYWSKSDVESASARNWVIVGDTKRFYYFVQRHATSYLSYAAFFFGDMLPPGADNWFTVLEGFTSPPSNPYSNSESYRITNTITPTGTIEAIRSFGGLTANSDISYWAPGPVRDMGGSTSSYWPSQCPIGEATLFEIFVWCESSSMLRGKKPGLWSPWETINPDIVPHLDVVNWNGKELLSIHITRSTNVNVYRGLVFIEIQAAWEY
jgi:hypothetical protein